MAETITIICPECEKSIKAPETVVGKKIRCKGCGETFTAKAPKATGKPAKPIKLKEEEEEGEGEGSYGVTEEYLGPRCPDCANAMEEGDIVCLHCGYNTNTRTKPQRKKVRDVTGGDIFLWLLPGILCAIASTLLLGLIIFFILWLIAVRSLAGEYDSYQISCASCCLLWPTILMIWLLYKSTRFAIKRLIFDNKPPEIEEKWIGK
jgi:hypothetical protein